MKILNTVLLLLFVSFLSFAQSANKPKLVVGIVIDQMRYDYLEKYYDDFSETGFKRLINNGSNFTNCRINYVPTVTGAGHASIYTGTTPFYHGIIANDWKDRKTLNSINCCSAISEAEVNNEGINLDRSPEQLMSTTIGDQLKLHTYGKSKVISISLKDRGSLLPAGKSADAAYWFDDHSGKFISSFHYFDRLPDWVIEFNNSGKIESYLDREWNLLKQSDVYEDLPEDNSPYEADYFNEGKTSFPHSLKNVPNDKLFSKLTYTPYGNQIIIDFVKETLKAENLGIGKFTDHLAISFSTPDKIGHEWGPQSYEVKDMYLRLDLQLADLLNTLDSHVGNGNYLLFLTADHGGMENTKYLHDMNFDAGVLESTNFYKDLEAFLNKEYNSNEIILTRFSRNLYLNYEEIENLNLDRVKIENKIKEYLLFNVPEINDVFVRSDLELMTAGRESNNYILNGFNKKRSGDILFSLKANYLNWEHKYGSQHGSGHEYDSHILLIFYGSNITHEVRNENVFITDIAATIADLIGINKPSDCIGIPLLKK